ncbi:non-canonical purine NTP pyrophosphatase [Lujinxingia litoralis]|uniref:dITP/XTP pyrophosphatase n=1 Tax=Lujinxingia litoralis TaxID=2211119 RepID=A0A328C510_9DELT|nr:non-canonical purine NTP pyrophosphatase [Lujinxingia litoralis]RAL21190.1 non-canonical purine NTP pyrophosphatase [Lujinxingia litoralis]
MEQLSTSAGPDDTFVIATTNAGKRREIAASLGDLLATRWQVLDRQSFPRPLDAVIEDADSFEGNAIKKGLWTARDTECVSLADDSGLVVDALGGAPGVTSARYAGEDADDAANNAKLIAAVQALDPQSWAGALGPAARFESVICLVLGPGAVGRALLARCGLTLDEVPGGAPRNEGELVRVGDLAVVWFRGTVEGQILTEPRGEGGFGYDPYFYVPSLGRTMAELTLEEKGAISHRGQALHKVRTFFGAR